MTKYIVNIEQPLINSFEVEAKDEEEAEEIAREKYDNGKFVLTIKNLGTDAQFQVCDKKGQALTEWN